MTKKKTHEEYVAELKEKNPDVEVIEEYKGMHIKIMHHCLTHDVYWKIQPSNALQGNGCPECKKDKIRNKQSKTHEQYVKEVAQINPNITVLDEYININTPILHKCLIDGYEWTARPYNILSGTGCPKCGGTMKKTHEQYVEEVALINPNIEVVGQYIDAKTSILHRCLIDGYEWMVEPTNILSGKGCPKCANNNRSKRQTLSHQQYIERLEAIHPCIVPVEQYINAKTQILHFCQRHKVEWYVAPDDVLHGCGCPECAKESFRKSRMRTQDEYISELSIKNPDLILIGDYLGNNMPTKHYCKIHDYTFNIAPNSTLAGHGCKYCLSDKIRAKQFKSEDVYIAELKEKRPDVKLVGKYLGALVPTEHLCLEHNVIWKVAPANIFYGNGCPQCYESKGERLVRLWLEKHLIEYIPQKKFDDCIDIQHLSFDFYLPYYNTLIEVNGKQHYEPIEYFGGQEKFNIQIKHDNMKKQYCEDNGIRLLCIRYDEDINEALTNFLFI